MTNRQLQLLYYIYNCGLKTPSYEEMKQYMGYVSKSSIHRLVTALEARGFVRKVVGSNRAVYLTEAGLRAVQE